ncbi:MAG: M20/M25/M40 family metallo-hydrolase [Ignavibacteriales bacterium]|nr:M20/M25/M40 family metallo-hydrolase [Ignavibacteriales bacterium]
MKSIIISIFYLHLLLAGFIASQTNPIFSKSSNSPSTDSLITSIVSEINRDSIRSYIQSLQDFKTRYAYCTNRDSISLWVSETFKRFGYKQVDYESFLVADYNQKDSILQRNVIATLSGEAGNNETVILGAHYDSFSYTSPLISAPGADDNATGVASLLEIARVIKLKGYEFSASIKFIAFAAEEIGRYGSGYYAKRAYERQEKIRFLINLDMIGHTLKPLTESKVQINYYDGFANFREFTKTTFRPFSKITPVTGSLGDPSDSYAFNMFGFPSIGFMETDITPNIHSQNDVLANLNVEYCTEAIKGICATVISAAEAPPNAGNIKVIDWGNGHSLICTWDKNEDSLLSYKIYLGIQHGVYDTSFITTNNFLIITNLSSDTAYFIGIASLDKDGNESLFIEKTQTPRSIPLTPTAFLVMPTMGKIELKWNPNQENDIIGYNVYRSNNLDDLPLRVNNEVVRDTFYLDNTVQKCQYYYYSIAAIDSQLNESPKTEKIKSRAVSLDQGILVVDETKDGTGILTNPSDEQVDAFFNQLLSNFNKKDYDIAKEGNVTFADLGAFSTVVWHGNDELNLLAYESKEDIKKYLAAGGRLLFVSYLPSKALVNNTSYKEDYIVGDFMYDVFKIKNAERKPNTLFFSAKPIDLSYNLLEVDTTKTTSNFNFHLKNIESISAAPGAKEIYTYDTKFDSTTIKGSMKGMPVGVEYLGNDYKVITLSFPLYYMKQEQAKELVQNIMLNKFNETTEVESKEENIIPAEYFLYQNYPNPFNPATKIEYSVPSSVRGEMTKISLKIFDILGREIETLVNEEKQPGNYEVVFDGSKFSSGIYFYILNAGDFRSSRKMCLIK